MKKIFILSLILATTSVSDAYASDDLNIGFLKNLFSNAYAVNDHGVSLKLGDIDRDSVGISLANTGAEKYKMNLQNDTTGAITSGNETELGLAYDHPVTDRLNTTFKLAYRNDVDNVIGESDGAAMFHVSYKFK